MTVIIGLQIKNKEANAVELQKVLTEFNCIIQVRLGINNTGIFCSEKGIIILAVNNKEDATALEKELINIDEIEIQRMIF